MIVGLNGGVYVNLCFVGDIICVWIEVLDKVEMSVLGVGLL